MRKYWWCIILLFLLCPEVQAERRKVGLVLSGGGAKGIAHIGAIKVLEEAGIPVDIVVGTSMGAIVGGLYAIGYDARTLDSLVRLQDWAFLLSDKVYRNKLTFSEKEATEKFLFSFPFGKDKESRMPAGFVSGQNISNLFADLTVGYHDSLDFKHLPVPFACVAANMVDGSEVVLDTGILMQAMRASMAIPGAFTPVRVDSLVLVDGGIVNNFPVDIAKAMGADIIIGIDVQSDLKTAGHLNSLPDVMGQLVNLMCLNKFDRNLALTDLYIRPDVKGYSAASFNRPAIDTLLRHGEEAARRQWDELTALKRRIGTDTFAADRQPLPEAKTDSFQIHRIFIKGISQEEQSWLKRMVRLKENTVMTRAEIHHVIALLYGTKAFTGVTYRLQGGPVYDLELTLKESEMNQLNLGFRFDSEDMAAILLNTRINFKALKGSRLGLTARLSKNPYIRVDYTFENPFLRRLNLGYMFEYNDFSVYQKGDKVNGTTYRYHMAEASLTDIYIRNFKFQAGLRYEYFDYDPFLYKDENQSLNVRSKGFISYYGLAHLETFDRRYYPSRGVSFKAAYSLYTDNFVSYDNRTPFSAISADFTGVISLTRRFKLLPSVYGRVLTGRDIPYPYLNYMGGDVYGRYMQQQLPFAGISHVEIFRNSLVAAKLHFRQRMGAKHYVSLIGNYALQNDDFFEMFGNKGIWGGGISYSYDLPLGPVSVMFSMSDWSEKLNAYFNLGFYF